LANVHIGRNAGRGGSDDRQQSVVGQKKNTIFKKSPIYFASSGQK
jgi:hypothetical protein